MFRKRFVEGKFYSATEIELLLHQNPGGLRIAIVIAELSPCNNNGVSTSGIHGMISPHARS